MSSLKNRLQSTTVVQKLLKAIYFDILDPHFLNVVSCRVVVRTAVVKRRLLFPSVVFLFAGMVMHRTKQASLMTDMSLI